MQEHRLAFLEEPVPFDYYDETKEIADAAAACRSPAANRRAACGASAG